MLGCFSRKIEQLQGGGVSYENSAIILWWFVRKVPIEE